MVLKESLNSVFWNLYIYMYVTKEYYFLKCVNKDPKSGQTKQDLSVSRNEKSNWWVSKEEEEKEEQECGNQQEATLQWTSYNTMHIALHSTHSSELLLL